jgi:glucose/arabinose dehydrogenase
MKRKVWPSVTCLCLLSTLSAVGCVPPEGGSAPTRADKPNSETVGTETTGGTEAAGAETQANGTSASQPTAYRVVSLARRLSHPWGLVWLPDGSLLITERAGQLRRWREGQLERRPIPGVPDVLVSGQGGLLDIALHPRFTENRLIYFTYADGTSVANRTRVARATFEGDALQDWQVIFEVTQEKSGSQHFGSRLLWLPDETLLVSFGDGGNPPIRLGGELIRFQAQNLDSYLGKVVRIQADGSIPADNPRIEGQAPSAIWTYGHRNIQGVAYDAIADRVWATEHGARGGDELNRLQVGENYGWPLVSHSREYSSRDPVAPVESQPGMVDPQIVWTPAIAPSGLTVYDGDVFPAWRGNLFAGGLVSQDIRRIVVDETGNPLEVEKIPIGQRVRDVRQGPDGLLYVLTDEDNGQLLRIEPDN